MNIFLQLQNSCKQKRIIDFNSMNKNNIYKSYKEEIEEKKIHIFCNILLLKWKNSYHLSMIRRIFHCTKIY